MKMMGFAGLNPSYELAMTLANIVARIEPTGSRECAPDDRLREIRDSRDADPGLRCAPSGLQPLTGSSDLPVGPFGVESFISDFPKIFVAT
jgi:hypothetical protein